MPYAIFSRNRTYEKNGDACIRNSVIAHKKLNNATQIVVSWVY